MLIFQIPVELDGSFSDFNRISSIDLSSNKISTGYNNVRQIKKESFYPSELPSSASLVRGWDRGIMYNICNSHTAPS